MWLTVCYWTRVMRSLSTLIATSLTSRPAVYVAPMLKALMSFVTTGQCKAFNYLCFASVLTAYVLLVETFRYLLRRLMDLTGGSALVHPSLVALHRCNSAARRRRVPSSRNVKTSFVRCSEQKAQQNADYHMSLVIRLFVQPR